MVGNKRAIILLFLNMIFYAIYDLKYVPIVILKLLVRILYIVKYSEILI